MPRRPEPVAVRTSPSPPDAGDAVQETAPGVSPLTGAGGVTCWQALHALGPFASLLGHATQPSLRAEAAPNTIRSV
jgi:hypothetical protein